MNDWNQYSLAEVCHNITDGKHGDCKPEPGSGYYFLSAKDVINGKVNYVGAREITKEDFLESHKRTRLEANDILITNSGTIGRIAIIKDSPLTSRSTFQKSVAIIKPKAEIVDSSYLYYYLTARKQSLVDSAGGTTQQNLLLKDLRSFKVYVPRLREQKAIAKILSSLDDKIELNRRMNATLEAMARALFKAWFVDFEPVHANRENRLSTSASPEIAKLFPSDFENNIPKGWQLRKLGDLVNVVKGRSYKSSELSDSKNALVTLKSFVRGGGYKSDGLKAYTGTFKPDQRIQDGEIIVACTDVTQAAEIIGRAAIFQSGYQFENHIASLDVQIVRPKEPETSLFYYHLMRSDDYVSHILSYISGTTVLHLAKDAIHRYKAIDPGKELVRLYADLMKPVFEKIRLNQNEAVSLSNLRDSLLPRLISGTIKLKEGKG